MKSKSKLTPIEWEIMEAVWQSDSKVTVRDIMDSAYPNGEKAYTTVMTMMNTLEKKGVLKREKIGMVNFYKASSSRRDLVSKETTHFVSKVFNGSVPALASYLINSDSLSQEELKAIRALLDEKTSQLEDGVND